MDVAVFEYFYINLSLGEKCLIGLKDVQNLLADIRLQQM
jgi:hypothetical protein